MNVMECPMHQHAYLGGTCDCQWGKEIDHCPKCGETRFRSFFTGKFIHSQTAEERCKN